MKVRHSNFTATMAHRMFILGVRNCSCEDHQANDKTLFLSVYVYMCKCIDLKPAY